MFILHSAAFLRFGCTAPASSHSVAMSRRKIKPQVASPLSIVTRPADFFDKEVSRIVLKRKPGNALARRQKTSVSNCGMYDNDGVLVANAKSDAIKKEESAVSASVSSSQSDSDHTVSSFQRNFMWMYGRIRLCNHVSGSQWQYFETVSSSTDCSFTSQRVCSTPN